LEKQIEMLKANETANNATKSRYRRLKDVYKTSHCIDSIPSTSNEQMFRRKRDVSNDISRDVSSDVSSTVSSDVPFNVSAPTVSLNAVLEAKFLKMYMDLEYDDKIAIGHR
jgi:hypothetical protein